MSVRSLQAAGPVQHPRQTAQSRLKSVLAAGFATAAPSEKRARTDKAPSSVDPSLFKWFGVEYVPFSIEHNRFNNDITVPILCIPEFYVIAHASSDGDKWRSVFKAEDRVAGVGMYDNNPYTPASPGWDTEVWTDAQPIGPPVNVTTSGNGVIVAQLYTAKLPLARVARKYNPEEDIERFDLQRYEEHLQESYTQMQRFYTDYFVLPKTGERFVLAEVYYNGKFVALGVTKYRVASDGGSSFSDELPTDPVAAAHTLLESCPWL